MSPTSVVILVVVIVGVDLILVPLIIRAAMQGGWKVIEKTHPAVEPEPDAVRKDFQSFKIGLMNLGYCVHVACDDKHLHMLPSLLLRVCSGKPMSVPWGSVEVLKRGKFSTQVKIAGVTLHGPHWCFDLVEPESDGGAT
jgi:hypothetical protein